jgi:large subunit ribosomal protein L30
MSAKLKVTQVKSEISHIARNRATVRALGLHGIGSTSVITDNPATRGMVRQVRFLVKVEEVDVPDTGGGAQARSRRGGGEHGSERTSVRERASGAANEEAGRISGGQESK